MAWEVLYYIDFTSKSLNETNQRDCVHRTPWGMEGHQMISEMSTESFPEMPSWPKVTAPLWRNTGSKQLWLPTPNGFEHPKERIDLDAQGGICHSSSQPILLVSCISHSSTLPQRTHHSTRTHVELPWNPQLPETSKTYQNFHVWNLPITLTLTRCGTVPARNANAKCHPTKEPSRNLDTCSKTPTGLSVLSDFLL